MDKWDEYWKNDAPWLCEKCQFRPECIVEENQSDLCGEFLRKKYDADLLSKFQDDISAIASRLEDVCGSVEAMCDRNREFSSNLPAEIRSIVNSLNDLYDEVGA